MLSLFSRRSLTPHGKKRRAYRAGIAAEWFVCIYMMCQGYRIVARRVRTPAGEVDIVAARGYHMVLIEVKYRSGDMYDVPVSATQRRRLERASAYIAQTYGQALTQIRRDVAIVRHCRIAYQKNAF